MAGVASTAGPPAGADARPCRPRSAGVSRCGERRRRCAPLQPAEGRPLARGERLRPSRRPAAGAGAVHPPGGATNPHRWQPYLDMFGRATSGVAAVGFRLQRVWERHEELLLDARMGLPRPSLFCRANGERAGGERGVILRVGTATIAISSAVYSRSRSPRSTGTSATGSGSRSEPSPTSAWESSGDERGRDEPLFTGRLANELAPYERTVGLPVMLQLREVELLPLVEVVESDHPPGRAAHGNLGAGAGARRGSAPPALPAATSRVTDPDRGLAPVRPGGLLDSQSLHEPGRASRPSGLLARARAAGRRR